MKLLRCASAAIAMGALLFLPGQSRVALAQIPGNKMPDVQVVVLPDAIKGEWSVSVTYPRQVPRAASQAHLKRLLGLSGWKANSVVYEDRGLPTNDGVSRNNKGKTDPIMSSVTFSSPSNIVNWDRGALPIEPFARAFRDLNRVYITFFVPGRFDFRGLRKHSDASLDVVLASGGDDPAKFGYRGAFTYLLTIRNHKLERLGLPTTQVVLPPGKVHSASRPNQKMAGARRVVGYGLVGLLALAGAGATYVFTHRLIGAR